VRTTSLPWKLLSLVGAGLATPWACSSTECNGPGGLCIELPKGTANSGGRGGAGGEREGGTAGDAGATTRGGSNGRGGSSGKSSRGGMGGAVPHTPGLAGEGGEESGGAGQTGSGGRGGSAAHAGTGAGGTLGESGSPGNGGAGAGNEGGGPVSGSAGGSGLTLCERIPAIPIGCEAEPNGAGGASGAGGEGGAAGSGEGWCAVPDDGAGGQDSSGGVGGTVGGTGGGGTPASGGKGAPGGRGGRGSGPGMGGTMSMGGRGSVSGPPTFFAIDDLEDGDVFLGPVLGARGSWYAVSEGSGRMFPSNACATSSGATAFVSHTSNYAMHVYGSGFLPDSDFAQVGISVRAGSPACDQPLDANQMTGIRFWAKGTTSLQDVTFMLGTPEIMPIDQGGTCTADCYDYFRVTEVLTNDWNEYFVPFSSMSNLTATNNLGNVSKRLLNLIWQAGNPGSQSGPGFQSPCFDFWIDDVAFYKTP